MTFRHRGRRSAVRIVGVGLALILASGCGGPFTASVSGKVTYKGEPLPGGVVTFVHPDGRTAYTTIHEDGSYTVPAAPGGDVRCIVQTYKPIPAPPKALADKLPGPKGKLEPVYPAGKYVPITEKYGNPDKSGLAYTIHRGSNTIDIPLD